MDVVAVDHDVETSVVFESGLDLVSELRVDAPIDTNTLNRFAPSRVRAASSLSACADCPFLAGPTGIATSSMHRLVAGHHAGRERLHHAETVDVLRVDPANQAE